MKYLRKIKVITRRDRVRNEVVRQELKVDPILKKVHKQQFKWFGHLMRMNKQQTCREDMTGQNDGKRKEDVGGKCNREHSRTKNVT